MTKDQIIMLGILVGYLILNTVLGMYISKKKDKESSMNFEKNLSYIYHFSLDFACIIYQAKHLLSLQNTYNH